MVVIFAFDAPLLAGGLPGYEAQAAREILSGFSAGREKDGMDFLMSLSAYERAVVGGVYPVKKEG